MTITKTPIRLEFEASGITGKVDRENGIIHDVSIITSGVTAKGHNLEVDDTTLRQMKQLAEKKKRVKTKWNHRSGADAVNGHLFNFRIDGGKLLADWKLLKKHDKYEQMLELAEEQPETVGLSASFMGENEEKGGKEFARCSELLSVDLVDSAAANPTGLFEAVDTPGAGTMKPSTATAPGGQQKEPVTLEALMGAVTGLRGELTAIGERVTRFETRFEEQEEEEEEAEENEGDEEEETTEFKTLADVVNYFERRVELAANEQERQEFEAAYTMLEEKVGALVELNEQLLAENEVMAGALKELQAKTKTTVEFSAGTEEGKPTIKITATPTGKPLTEFEARVKELQEGGKKYGEALLEAQAENSGRYQRHLEAKGAFAQTL